MTKEQLENRLADLLRQLRNLEHVSPNAEVVLGRDLQECNCAYGMAAEYMSNGKNDKVYLCYDEKRNS